MLYKEVETARLSVNSDSLLKTIRAGNNLQQMALKLPKPNYEEHKLMNRYSSQPRVLQDRDDNYDHQLRKIRGSIAVDSLPPLAPHSSRNLQPRGPRPKAIMQALGEEIMKCKLPPIDKENRRYSVDKPAGQLSSRGQHDAENYYGKYYDYVRNPTPIKSARGHSKEYRYQR